MNHLPDQENPGSLVAKESRNTLLKLFLSLNPENKALWGKMNPQQMVEHLIEQVQYTNGTKEPFCEVSEEEAMRAKLANIYSDREIPKNVILGELPDQLRYPDLQTAIDQLMTELDTFDQYFKTPGTTAIHGGFGAMNEAEWLIWHSKHFKHHLKQFGLMPFSP